MPDAQSQHRRITLEAIHDSAVDAIITIDERGLIETINPATEALLGFSSEELIGRNVSMLMPTPFRQEHDDYLKNYLRTGKRKITGIGREVIAQRKNGTTLPIHLTVSEVRLGDRRVFAGFIRDMTVAKTLEEREATLGRIIEDSLNEVFIFRVDNLQFVQVNRGGRENLGFTLEELSQMTPVDIKPEFTESQFRSLLEPLLTGEKKRLEIATTHQRADGSTYDVEVHVQTSSYHTQPVFVAIILDVTEKLEAERLYRQQQETMQADLARLVTTRTEELRLAQSELVRIEKFATLGKVSGGIAHEIRNPLNAVKTSAYYLLHAKNPTAEKMKEHLERIDRQVSMIDNVVTALSDVARMPEANLSPTDMEHVLQHIIATTNLPDNIRTAIEFSEPIPEVLVDENQIAIAFRNLIRNARDAMPEGGTISIRAAFNGEDVVFSVVDTGSGIPPEVIGRIWEPLFTTKARGMGLGLSITRAIVEKNAGELTVESEVGKGSHFKIALKPRRKT